MKRRQQGKSSTSHLVRLNKLIADAGITSRRGADTLIAEGKVKVNGKLVKELGTKVSPGDNVLVNGRQIGGEARKVYLLLNKPKNVITTTTDERGRKTVLDLVRHRERIYPVGRLDRNTTGVLLLTNDGDLSFRLMHPSYGVERHYRAILNKPLDLEHAKQIAQGVEIGPGEETQPCYVSVEEKDRTRVEVTIREGKNREVRRMFENFDYEVLKLDRKSYAGLTTRGLGRGEWRALTRTEVEELRQMVGLHKHL